MLNGVPPTIDYVLAKEPQTCFMCGSLTWYVELNFEAPLCSAKCDKLALKEIDSLISDEVE